MLSNEQVRDLDSQEIRADWLRVFGTLRIEPPASVHHVTCFGQCSVGAFSYTNHDCEMFDTDIGRYCSIGQNVLINPGHHPIGFLTTHVVNNSRTGEAAGMERYDTYRRFAMTQQSRPTRDTVRERVSIGHDVWIGANAVITGGVSIGTGAIIGAGAVVTRDVEPYAIVGGVSARLIRFRLPEDLRGRLLAAEWWRYDLSALRVRDYSDPERMIGRIEARLGKGTLPLYAPAAVVIAP